MNKQVEEMKKKIGGMNEQQIKAALYDNQIANEDLSKEYTARRTTIAGERKELINALQAKQDAKS